MVMMGTVSDDGREEVLSVEVRSPDRADSLRVEAVVDTRLTGHLTLSPAIVETAGLPIIGSTESLLADGSLVWVDVCLARVRWHERERPARVLVTDAPPLLGMELLHGSELHMACVGGGAVVITELEG